MRDAIVLEPTTPATQERMDAFTKLVETDNIARLVEQKLDCEANISNSRVTVRPGKKYNMIVIGSGCRYMVEKSTSIIYGTKAWNQIHKGHAYGTLDTITQWAWGDYYARRK